MRFLGDLWMIVIFPIVFVLLSGLVAAVVLAQGWGVPLLAD